jgi:hypothetical protein
LTRNEERGRGGPPVPADPRLLNWIPFVLVVVVVAVYLVWLRPRRYRAMLDEQERHIHRANEHMDRVEEKLDRVIDLLEKRWR